MAIQTLSDNLITQRKKETLESQALRKTVPFRDINIIDEKSIEYQGARIEITKTAFKSLLKLVGMSQQFAKKFETLFTSTAKSQFINRMKDAMASNSGNMSEINLILNPISKQIVGFSKAGEIKVSNGQFTQVAEDIISKHSMDITNWSVDPTTGIATIDAYNPKAEFGIDGMRDEVFTGGVTFQNSPIGGFQVMPYVNRQWCANGLTAQMSKESYTLHSLSGDNMEKFFQHINELRKNNFAPTDFGDRVRAAHNTPASLHEMKFAHQLIDRYAGERTENWVPLQENMNAYHKAGFENLNADQMKGAKTNTSVWDLVNGVTHFSSHGADIIDTNMQDYEAANIQARVSNILGKSSYDHENHMPNVFENQELVRSGSLLN